VPSHAASDTAIARGQYLFNAAGCRNCHTDDKKKGPLLAGGGALKTPFGTFYGPNITPHRGTGIGGWSDADFIRAMREGIAPDGRHYYPAFPYTSFTRMTDADLRDLKAYIFSLPPVARRNRSHDLSFPYGIRAGLWFWKKLYLEKGPHKQRADRSLQWNRGAYLVEALTHCGECHTPRGTLGALDRGLWLAGTKDGPEGEPVPNITPDPKTGIGGWKTDEIIDALETGSLPDGDEFGSLMADVVEHGTSKLTAADRRAIAVYLKSLKPVENRISSDEKKAN
jgi:mono/diheme cytochrome c family protein